MSKLLKILLLLVITLPVTISVQAKELEPIGRCVKTFKIGYPGKEVDLNVTRQFKEFTKQGLTKQKNLEKNIYDDSFKLISDPSKQQDCAAYTVDKLWPGIIGKGFVTGSGFYNSIIVPFGKQVSTGYSWGDTKVGDVVAFFGPNAKVAGHIAYVTKVDWTSVTIYTKDNEEAAYEHKLPLRLSKFFTNDPLFRKYAGGAKIYRIKDKNKIKISDTISPGLLCNESEVWGKELDKAIQEAQQDTEGCKFKEASETFQSIVDLAADPNKVKPTKSKDFYYINNPSQLKVRNREGAEKKASKQLKKVKKYQQDQKAAQNTITKVESDLKNCRLSSVQSDLNKIIANDKLKMCSEQTKARSLLKTFEGINNKINQVSQNIEKAKERLEACDYAGIVSSMDSILNDADLKKCSEYQEAEEQKTLAEALEANKKKADDALAAANKALERAKNAVTDATNEKKKISELKAKAESALAKGRSKLSDLSGAEDKCARIKELASELATAVTIAESSAEDVAPYYQTTKDARKEACELADEADLAEDKEELEGLRDKAYSLAREALDAKENAEEKAKEAGSSATEAENKKGSIDTLLEGIGNVAEAKAEFNKGLSGGDIAEVGDSEGDGVVTIPSITGTCYQDMITRAKEVKADADSKRAEAEKLTAEASTMKGELEQVRNDINEEIANLPSEETLSCDAGQLADEKDARAAADTAELFAEQSSENWAQTEKCASRLRQAVLEFEEEEPSEDIPEIFAEGEVVDDPGYLGGECSGRIMASPTRGYQGDSIIYTVIIEPPYDEEVVRVTTNNPGCTSCDAKKESQGRYTLAHKFLGAKNTFKTEFLAYNGNGEVICSGSTVSLRGLGPKR